MRRYGLQDLRTAEVKQIQALTQKVLEHLKDLMVGDDIRIVEWKEAERNIAEIGSMTLNLGNKDLLNIPTIRKGGIVKQFDTIIEIWQELFPLVQQNWYKNHVVRIRTAEKVVRMLKRQSLILA